MIPKIIHYVWFSDPPEYPDDVIKCMDSWKKHLPDYEIIHWNAKNFDLSLSKYAQEAYIEKKYAFASDYVRLWVLYNYGGIYLDSDIEVIKNFDSLLSEKAFTCFEDKDRIAAWIFGSEKGNPLFKEFLDDYNDRSFILENGMYDLTPNPVPITNRLIEHGLQLDGNYQKLDDITIFSMDYFCPFNPYRDGDDCFTDNTYVNHHFNGEWKRIKTDRERIYKQKEEKYQRIFGQWLGGALCFHIESIKYSGVRNWFKKHIFERLIRK
ncbi:MAG: glycosyl transferase [Lachnospiraceae bacterium]|nr:glycosyl transferase [Lachnospiraceae bacterium]